MTTTISSIQTGRDTIKMFRDLFQLGDMPISSIVLRADLECVTTLEITGFAKPKDIDISIGELSSDDVTTESKYEITIKKIGG